MSVTDGLILRGHHPCFYIQHLSFLCVCVCVCVYERERERYPKINVYTELFIISSPQVHVKSESLAIKISQEINYAKSLYFEQQLMLPASENEDCLLLES